MGKWRMKYFVQPNTIVLTDEAENFAWMQGEPESFVPFSDVEYSSKVHGIEELDDQRRKQVRLLREIEENDERENLCIYSYDGDVIAGYAGNPGFFVRLEWEAYLCLDDAIVNDWARLKGNTYTTPINAVLLLGNVDGEGIYFANPEDEWEGC